MAEKQTSYTFKLSPKHQATLVGVLKSGNYRPFPLEHTIIAVSRPDCKICLYKSGKCLVQGSGARDFVMFVLEPLVLKEARLGYDEIVSPEAYQPHMGIDESGKGDFFGPLVIAGVYLDRETTTAMKEMGMRDSKNISSDSKAIEMARAAGKLLGGRYSIVSIGPAAYNRLYAGMRNVNRILAWAHARAIENLLEKVPSCPMAISDQFGSKDQVNRALMKEGRKIELIQRHKAESDPAVATASVLARSAFLLALKKLEKRFELPFPKGASDAVKEAAVRLLEKNGPSILLETAKCHFRTTDAVLAELNTDRSVLGETGKATSKPRQRTGF